MTDTTLFRWDGANATTVARRFRLPYVELLAEATSTLDVAHARAEEGKPGGSLIVADAQRAGRGRMGRGWSSEPGTGVWATMIERPDAGALDVLSLRVGLAVAARLDALAGERVGLKWPNDLMVGAGKLGGILVEARWSGASLSWVAIGVGVNVIAPDGVAQAAGMPPGVRRMDVLAAIVDGVREAASKRGQLAVPELSAFRERDILRGRRLASPGVGMADGITGSGALIVRGTTGIEHHRAGTVQFAEGDRT